MRTRPTPLALGGADPQRPPFVDQAKDDCSSSVPRPSGNRLMSDIGPLIVVFRLRKSSRRAVLTWGSNSYRQNMALSPAASLKMYMGGLNTVTLKRTTRLVSTGPRWMPHCTDTSGPT